MPRRARCLTTGPNGEAKRWAPARSEIDPADIRLALGDTFMLAADFADDIRLRLAGTRVCALFAREIKGEAFNSLWCGTCRDQIDKLLTCVLDEKIGAVAGVLGRTENGAEIELEMLLLPLALEGRSRVRALGILAPLAPPYWLGENPVIELDLGTFRHIGAGQPYAAEHFGAAHGAPRMRHGFLV